MEIVSYRVKKYIFIGNNGITTSSDSIPTECNIDSKKQENGHSSYTVSNFMNSFYCFYRNNTIYIAKNIKTLHTHLKNGCLVIDSNKRDYYLEAGFVFAPWTLYQDTYMICPGFMYEVDNGTFSILAEWKSTKNTTFDMNTFKELLHKIISDGVNESDRICITLSGGLDSALIAYYFKSIVGSNAYTITAEMPRQKSERNRALDISGMFGFRNIPYKYSKEHSDYNSILLRYTNDTLLPMSDPIIPVLYDMLEKNIEDKNNIVVEGQGADSVCFGLPHNALMQRYSAKLWLIYKIIYSVIPNVKSRSNSFLRKIYRIKKALYCYSHNSNYEAYYASYLSNSLDNEFTCKIKEYFKQCFEHYSSDQHAVAHIMLFSVLSAREMNKYSLLKSEGIQVFLPFLDARLIEYTFNANISSFVNNKVRKKPLYDLGEEWFPGLFKLNSTSPFYIDYELTRNSKKPSSNVGGRYASKGILDEMQQKNYQSLSILESILRKLNQE